MAQGGYIGVGGPQLGIVFRKGWEGGARIRDARKVSSIAGLSLTSC